MSPFDPQGGYKPPSIKLPDLPGLGGAASAPSSRPLLGTVWGYPGDGMDNGLTAWGIDTKGKYRNILGVSLPTEGKFAVPLSSVPLGGLVTVRSSQTGESITVPRIDKGPAAWTNKGIDLTFNAARALGLNPSEGTFAGLYVTPTGQSVTKDQLDQYLYTGLDWIAPGASNAMKEAPTGPIKFQGTASPQPASSAAVNWQKIGITVAYAGIMVILVISLLKDQTPGAVIVGGAKNTAEKIKGAATIAAV